MKHLLLILCLAGLAAIACKPQPSPAPCPTAASSPMTADTAAPAPGLQLEVMALQAPDVFVFTDVAAAPLAEPATEAHVLGLTEPSVAMAPPLIIGATTLRSPPGLWRQRTDRSTLAGLHAATRTSASPRTAIWLC